MGTAPHVTIDRDFLARVYDGPDPAGFARFVGLAAGSPEFLVYAERPATLGVLEWRRCLYEHRLLAFGHYLHGDWSLLRRALGCAARAGADLFCYPVLHGRANAGQVASILTRRYGFRPYATHYYADLKGPHELENHALRDSERPLCRHSGDLAGIRRDL